MEDRWQMTDDRGQILTTGKRGCWYLILDNGRQAGRRAKQKRGSWEGETEGHLEMPLVHSHGPGAVHLAGADVPE